ncbi:unnamed protein product [Meganyctiphanes norvegica]|uniref:Uncharacterized protein n=1 Tax=Meganyctiphanes norvegica TaxID=48144 RepID=A0AAV2QMY6_MEGNR
MPLFSISQHICSLAFQAWLYIKVKVEHFSMQVFHRLSKKNYDSANIEIGPKIGIGKRASIRFNIIFWSIIQVTALKGGTAVSLQGGRASLPATQPIPKDEVYVI